MLRNRSFRFSQEITVLSTLAALLCYGMGYWQYTRYLEKKIYVAAVEKGEQRGRVALNPNQANWTEQLHSLIHTQGTFDYDHEMVLINRSMGNDPGVRVVTPLELSSGAHVLVDRGFLPYDLYDKQQVDAYRPRGLQVLEGTIRPSKTKSFFLAPPPQSPGMNENQDRWLRLDVAAMAETLPYPILPVFVEQTNQQGEHPSYDPKALLPPSRHLNYTFQWASFGTFALFFGFFLQFRPKRPEQASQSGLGKGEKPLVEPVPKDVGQVL